MKHYLDVLIKSLLAGILIGIAGTIYLAVYPTSPILAVVLFGFGLLIILAQGYYLYTGKVGYAIDNKPKYLIDLLIMIVGNLLGTILIALIVRLAGLSIVVDTGNYLVDKKLGLEIHHMFGLSVLCGMLMYLAAEGYRRVANDVARVVIVIFAVTIFLLGTFEHSIADMFYFTVTFRWNWQTIGMTLLVLLGNGLGSVLLNLLEKGAKLKDNVCPTSYYEEVKKEPKVKKDQNSEPHNFDNM